MPDSRWAAGCPGQGIDPRDVAAVITAHPDDPLVGRLADLCGTRRWDELDVLDTRVAQPAVHVASVLAARHAGVPWAAAVGHSLGELAAAVIAGALAADDALELVVERARLGHEAAQARPGQMLVVMRLDDVAVERARRLAIGRVGGVVEVATRNGPGQVVLSGDVATVAVVADLVDEAGGVARALPIGGSFHSPVLADAVAPFTAAVAARAQPPSLPLVSSTTATVLDSAAAVAAALGDALVLPVRWPAATEAVAALGADAIVDVGPGRTLANLARHGAVLTTTALDDLPPIDAHGRG